MNNSNRKNHRIYKQLYCCFTAYTAARQVQEKCIAYCVVIKNVLLILEGFGGNEIHFLVECEIYHDLLHTLLGHNLNMILTMTQVEHTFIDILSSQDISKQKNLAQYLQQAAEVRTKNLNMQPENFHL